MLQVLKVIYKLCLPAILFFSFHFLHRRRRLSAIFLTVNRTNRSPKKRREEKNENGNMKSLCSFIWLARVGCRCYDGSSCSLLSVRNFLFLEFHVVNTSHERASPDGR